ncbi:MAG: hypothetical protein Q9160_005749 [Pyrenula sp. 1 TL-2023]
MRLIRSPNCGYWRLEDNPKSGAAQLTSFNTKNLNDTTAAASYSRECYGGSSSTLQCGSMAAASIPYTVNLNATCPFGDDLCLISNTAAFQINATIDSHTLLGINAPEHQRVEYQKVTTCAPCDTLYYYNYGPLANDKYSAYSTNYTYYYNSHGFLDNIGYGVTAIQYNANTNVKGSWDPIPPLRKTDGDISIIFIAFNSIRFVQPTYDPVFHATTPGGNITSEGETTSWWNADYWNSVIGCVDQHSICNPNRSPPGSPDGSGGDGDGDGDSDSDSLCTPLSGSSSLINASTNARYGFTPRQIGAITRIANQALYTNTYIALAGRGDSALRAQETVNSLDQAPLSDTHWTDEITSWFTTGLAHLQRGVLEYAAGPSNVDVGTYIWAPEDPVSRAMCRNQLVRSTLGTVSFSVLGVAVILAVGGFIVLLSFVLESVVGWAQKRWKRGQWRREGWRRDEALQVQRALFEQKGWGRWGEGAEEMAVPVCEGGERFGGLGGEEGGEGLGMGRRGGQPEEVGLMGEGLAKRESRVEVREKGMGMGMGRVGRLRAEAESE